MSTTSSMSIAKDDEGSGGSGKEEEEEEEEEADLLPPILSLSWPLRSFPNALFRGESSMRPL